MPRTLPRLLLVSDGRGDAVRLADVVRAALAVGVRAVQVRERAWSARELAAFCVQLQPDFAAVDGLLLVNDRVDVAAAGCCAGVQIGHRSLPPAAARRALGPQGVLGCSAHDETELAAAAVAGADFALLSPVWPTASKPLTPSLGIWAAGALTATACVPVLWLGGVTAARIAAVAELPPTLRPRGFAVMGAVFAAADPANAAAALLQAVDAALDA